MKHCACGWSGDDSYTQCPNAAAHPKPSVSRATEDAKDRERRQVVAGVGGGPNGLTGPVRHFLSDRMDVYLTDDGRYVTADGKPVRSGKKGLR